MPILIFILVILAINALCKQPEHYVESIKSVKKNNRYIVDAVIVDKYTADGGSYAVFKTNEGEKLSIRVTGELYGELDIGNKGVLYYGIKDGAKVFGSWDVDEGQISDFFEF